MRREDYLLRLIYRMGQFWTRIVQSIGGRDYAEARALITQAYEELLGMPADDAAGLSVPDLLARINLGEIPEVGRDRSLALATLLKAEGDLYAAQRDDDAAQQTYHKALDVLLSLFERVPDVELPEYAPQIVELVRLIGVANLELPTRAVLMSYFEQSGSYALAEDVLYSLLDDLPDNREVREAGIRFYQRLLALPDAALEAGNLPRDEIENALAELQS